MKNEMAAYGFSPKEIMERLQAKIKTRIIKV
jgi:hypothetical protein